MSLDLQNPQIIYALNESAKNVYLVLKKRQLKVDEIQTKTKLAPRTIRQAVSKLLKLRLIRKVPDLHDMRSHYYVAAA